MGVVWKRKEKENRKEPSPKPSNSPNRPNPSPSHSLPRSAQANPRGPLPQSRPLSSPWAHFNSARPSKHAGLAPRFPPALWSARVNTEPQAHPPARPRRPSPVDPGDPRRQLRLPRRATALPRKSRSCAQPNPGLLAGSFLGTPTQDARAFFKHTRDPLRPIHHALATSEP